MTSSKIEDVARAIDGALWHQIDTMEKYAVGGVETMSSQRSNSLRIARDAIKALREPTEAMACAGDEAILERLTDHTGVLKEPTTSVMCWSAMISEILK